MSVSNTVTKVEEFDFEDEALEVLETDAELTSDEELVAVEGASEDVREEFSLMLLRKVLMRPRCISAKLVFHRSLLPKKKCFMLVVPYVVMKPHVNA